MNFLTQHGTTILVIALLVLLLFKGTIFSKLFGIKNLSVSELHAQLKTNAKSMVVLDVRTLGEWQSGSIPLARHIPMDELKEKLGVLHADRKRTIAVICQTGSRSLFAAHTLKKAGFSQVANVSGGISAWQRQGFELKK